MYSKFDTAFEALQEEMERFVEITNDLIYDSKLHKDIMIQINNFVNEVKSSEIDKESKALYISMAEELLAIASDSTAFP